MLFLKFLICTLCMERMKNMKKVISIMLTVTIILSAISFPMAFADGSVTVESYNFNDNLIVPAQFSISTPSSGTRTLGVESMLDDATYGNSLKLTLAGRPGWTDFYWNTATYTAIDNSRIEVEFDIQPYGVRTAGYNYVQFRLQGLSSYPIALLPNGSIGLYSLNGSLLATLGQMPSTWVWADSMNWFRIKIVLEKAVYNVDGTNYTIQKLAGLYVDGIMLLLIHPNLQILPKTDCFGQGWIARVISMHKTTIHQGN
jgi:hypothetical protein